MSSLKIFDDKICVGEEVLLEFRKPIRNYSRLPLIQEKPELISLYDVLITLIRCGKDTDRFGEQIKYINYYQLMYFITSKYMIRIPGTRISRTVELGADNWILGYHLNVLLGAFHTENEYRLVTDCRDADSFARLKDLINREKIMEGLKVINSRYGDLPLKEHSFDLVVLNGSTVSEAPGKMVEDAVRLVKDGGVILAFNQFSNTVFEDIYRLKNSDKVRDLRTYELDDKNAEIAVVEFI